MRYKPKAAAAQEPSLLTRTPTTSLLQQILDQSSGHEDGYVRLLVYLQHEIHNAYAVCVEGPDLPHVWMPKHSTEIVHDAPGVLSIGGLERNRVIIKVPILLAREKGLIP
jgi:hypothetical protein